MPKAKKIAARKPSAPRGSWLQRWRAARVPLAISGMALVVYSRSLFCGFVRDDIPQIVNNPQVQSWSLLPQLLGSHLWSQTHDQPAHFYRPLFSLWMLLMYTCGGFAPWFWHLSSIFLHVVATWLVFRLCRRLTANDLASAAAAAIFAVHPIHMDAVTWISASCEVLFTIFVLAAMLVLFPREGESAVRRLWLSALLFGAGLLAKETGMVMLAILPVMAWIRLKGQAAGKERLWKAGFPYGAVSAGYLLVRWAVLRAVGVESGEHSWAQVVFSAPSILLFYLKKLFLPWNLSGSYVNTLTASPNAAFWLEFAAIAIGLGSVAWFAVRYRSVFGFAGALIVIPILPALAVIRIYQQGDMTHDRYLYLPSVGVSLLVALLIAKTATLDKQVKAAGMTAATVVLAAFTIICVSQQKYYQDDIAFYSRVIQISPTDAFAMGMLGNVYLDQGRNDLALEQFERANQVDPGNQRAEFFRARGLFVSGRFQEAESILNSLLQTPSPDAIARESALLSLANVEISLGHLDYARQLLDQVERSNDKFPQLHWAQGVLYQRQGLLTQALTAYEKEVDVTGDELARQRAASVAKMIQAQSAGSSQGRGR